MALDSQNNVSGLDVGVHEIEGAAGKDFGYLNAVAFIFGIGQNADMPKLMASGGTVAGAGVGSVEFSKHFGEHVGEVEVIVDVGELGGIIVVVVLPVNAVEGRVVEFLLYLLPAVLEDILALRLGLELVVSGEAHGLVLAGCNVKF